MTSQFSGEDSNPPVIDAKELIRNPESDVLRIAGEIYQTGAGSFYGPLDSFRLELPKDYTGKNLTYPPYGFNLIFRFAFGKVLQANHGSMPFPLLSQLVSSHIDTHQPDYEFTRFIGAEPFSVEKTVPTPNVVEQRMFGKRGRAATQTQVTTPVRVVTDYDGHSESLQAIRGDWTSLVLTATRQGRGGSVVDFGAVVPPHVADWALQLAHDDPLFTDKLLNTLLPNMFVSLDDTKSIMPLNEGRFQRIADARYGDTPRIDRQEILPTVQYPFIEGYKPETNTEVPNDGSWDVPAERYD